MNERPRPSLADLMTIGNGLCGFVGLLLLAAPRRHGLSHDARDACLLLYGVGLVLDIFDGAVAKRRGGSGLGPILDALSDTVTFGMLPGGLLVAQSTGAGAGRVAMVAAAVAYAAATMVRLARGARRELLAGSVVAPGDPRVVTGLPSPVGGNCVMAMLLLWPGDPAVAAGVLLTATLLVSDFRFFDMDGIRGVYVGTLILMGFLNLLGVLPLTATCVGTLGGVMPAALSRALPAWLRGLRRRQPRAADGLALEPRTGG